MYHFYPVYSTANVPYDIPHKPVYLKIILTGKYSALPQLLHKLTIHINIYSQAFVYADE